MYMINHDEHTPPTDDSHSLNYFDRYRDREDDEMSHPPAKRARMSSSLSPPLSNAQSQSSRPRGSKSPEERSERSDRPLATHSRVPGGATLQPPGMTGAFGGSSPYSSLAPPPHTQQPGYSSQAQHLPSLQSATGWRPPSPGPPAFAGPSGYNVVDPSLGRRGSAGGASERDASSEGSNREPGRDRPPRSMMACVRCRKQKMKCDGPASAPCRGCRGANVTCVFETRTRTRPKSISSITTAQPLPAVMSTASGVAGPTYTHTARASLDPYHFAAMTHPGSSTPQQRPREMAPPGSSGQHPTSGVSMSSPGPLHSQIYSSVQSTPRASISGGPRPQSPYATVPPYGPLSFALNPLSSPQQRPHSPLPPTSTNTENRLRSLEANVRAIDSLQTSHNALQTTVAYLETQQRSLSSQIGELRAGRSPERTSITRESLASFSGDSRRELYISEQAWESYRSFISPLAPWLVVLSNAQGLSGEVVACLGARVNPDASTAEMARGKRVREEIGRLMMTGERWSEDDVRALGVFATWEGNSALTCLAVGQARAVGNHRSVERGSMRDARAWVELVIHEHLMHIPDFIPSLTHTPIASLWRARLRGNETTSPAVRDRDIKLLAWLEYAELLAEVQHGVIIIPSTASDRPLSPIVRMDVDRPEPESLAGGARLGTIEESPKTSATRERRAKRSAYLARWDGWKTQWGSAGDPILALHFHYAILLTASPLAWSDTTVWQEMMQETAGYEQLEKARDAAVELIRSICSPEIARTLPYSLSLFRSHLGLAVSHLISQMTTIPHSPLTPIPLIQSVLRLAYERLGGGTPSQWPINQLGPPPLTGSLLVECVEGGNVGAVGKREVVGREAGRDLWKRVVGGA